MSEQEIPDNDFSKEEPNTVDNCDSLNGTEQTDNALQKKYKVDILFKATGDAPIIKRKRWVVDGLKTVGWVMAFLKDKVLQLGSSDTLYVYVNQRFAPSPDERLLDLYECFGTEGKLLIFYSKTPAWG